MAEEIDVEKCNFRKFRNPVTLTLTMDRVEVVLVRISANQIRSKSGKLFMKVYGRTYGLTDGRT